METIEQEQQEVANYRKLIINSSSTSLLLPAVATEMNQNDAKQQRLSDFDAFIKSTLLTEPPASNNDNISTTSSTSSAASCTRASTSSSGICVNNNHNHDNSSSAIECDECEAINNAVNVNKRNNFSSSNSNRCDCCLDKVSLCCSSSVAATSSSSESNCECTNCDNKKQSPSSKLINLNGGESSGGSSSGVAVMTKKLKSPTKLVSKLDFNHEYSETFKVKHLSEKIAGVNNENVVVTAKNPLSKSSRKSSIKTLTAQSSSASSSTKPSPMMLQRAAIVANKSTTKRPMKNITNDNNNANLNNLVKVAATSSSLSSNDESKVGVVPHATTSSKNHILQIPLSSSTASSSSNPNSPFNQIPITTTMTMTTATTTKNALSKQSRPISAKVEKKQQQQQKLKLKSTSNETTTVRNKNKTSNNNKKQLLSSSAGDDTDLDVSDISLSSNSNGEHRQQRRRRVKSVMLKKQQQAHIQMHDVDDGEGEAEGNDEEEDQEEEEKLSSNFYYRTPPSTPSINLAHFNRPQLVSNSYHYYDSPLPPLPPCNQAAVVACCKHTCHHCHHQSCHNTHYNHHHNHDHHHHRKNKHKHHHHHHHKHNHNHNHKLHHHHHCCSSNLIIPIPLVQTNAAAINQQQQQQEGSLPSTSSYSSSSSSASSSATTQSKSINSNESTTNNDSSLSSSSFKNKQLSDLLIEFLIYLIKSNSSSMQQNNTDTSAAGASSLNGENLLLLAELWRRMNRTGSGCGGCDSNSDDLNSLKAAAAINNSSNFALTREKMPTNTTITKSASYSTNRLSDENKENKESKTTNRNSSSSNLDEFDFINKAYENAKSSALVCSTTTTTTTTTTTESLPLSGSSQNSDENIKFEKNKELLPFVEVNNHAENVDDTNIQHHHQQQEHQQHYHDKTKCRECKNYEKNQRKYDRLSSKNNHLEIPKHIEDPCLFIDALYNQMVSTTAQQRLLLLNLSQSNVDDLPLSSSAVSSINNYNLRASSTRSSSSYSNHSRHSHDRIDPIEPTIIMSKNKVKNDETSAATAATTLVEMSTTNEETSQLEMMNLSLNKMILNLNGNENDGDRFEEEENNDVYDEAAELDNSQMVSLADSYSMGSVSSRLILTTGNLNKQADLLDWNYDEEDTISTRSKLAFNINCNNNFRSFNRRVKSAGNSRQFEPLTTNGQHLRNQTQIRLFESIESSGSGIKASTDAAAKGQEGTSNRMIHHQTSSELNEVNRMLRVDLEYQKEAHGGHDDTLDFDDDYADDDDEEEIEINLENEILKDVDDYKLVYSIDNSTLINDDENLLHQYQQHQSQASASLNAEQKIIKLFHQKIKETEMDESLILLPQQTSDAAAVRGETSSDGKLIVLINEREFFNNTAGWFRNLIPSMASTTTTTKNTQVTTSRQFITWSPATVSSFLLSTLSTIIAPAHTSDALLTSRFLNEFNRSMQIKRLNSIEYDKSLLVNKNNNLILTETTGELMKSASLSPLMPAAQTVAAVSDFYDYLVFNKTDIIGDDQVIDIDITTSISSESGEFESSPSSILALNYLQNFYDSFMRSIKFLILSKNVFVLPLLLVLLNLKVIQYQNEPICQVVRPPASSSSSLAIMFSNLANLITSNKN